MYVKAVHVPEESVLWILCLMPIAAILIPNDRKKKQIHVGYFKKILVTGSHVQVRDLWSHKFQQLREKLIYSI